MSSDYLGIRFSIDNSYTKQSTPCIGTVQSLQKQKKINVFCVANKICTCTSYSSYKATSWILMGLCTISKYIVIDSTELSSLWQKCCTVNVHVAGQLLYYRLSYTTTAINIIIDLARWPDVSL